MTNDQPLSYCTNVHPGLTVPEVFAGLREFTLPIQQAVGSPIAAGLWLANPVVQEILRSPEGLHSFASRYAQLGLPCYTLNTFPFGNFHSQRVKEQVYLPDWSRPERLDYTVGCARILAALLPENTDGSLSTVPLGFKGFAHPADFLDRCAGQLMTLAAELHRLAEETGRRIRLAIEPEPFCVLETTAETIAFFQLLRTHAERQGLRDVADEYLGVCYDVCHQAVEFEDITQSIHDLSAADIRINKIHLTCAIEVPNPGTNPEAREALVRYVEPRYLHQTMALGSDGKVLRSVDLSPELVSNPPREFVQAALWRVHFHVPVDVERLGPLGTTRVALKEVLACLPRLSYRPHLEVETYTWEVLPGSGFGNAAGNLAERLVPGMAREIQATQRLLSPLA